MSGGRSAAAAPSAVGGWTFAFVDLAGFSALTEIHGDDQAVDLLGRFVGYARDALTDGGQLVKSIGDAVMLRFDTPVAGLWTLQHLLARCQSDDGFPLPRAGAHHGPAIERGDDWFGATVNLAARVAGQAAGGQTLATAVMAGAAQEEGIAVSRLGSFRLRNIAEPVELYEVGITAPVEATSTDPVCRMQVRHDSAAGRLRHGGQDFWFCSLSCARAFIEDPARHSLAREV